MADAKSELLWLLDRKVFDPTISEDPGDYLGPDHATLEDVQDTARKTKENYHRYDSAEHIKQMFEDDLRSPYRARQTQELHELGLPAFPDVEEEFEHLARKHRLK